MSSQNELDSLVFTRKDCNVMGFVQMSDSVVEVILEKKRGLAKASNIRSNVVLASYVTAFARVEMDRSIRILESIGAIIWYSDTGEKEDDQTLTCAYLK